MWQASGVTVQQDCVVTFNDLKLGHKFRYIVYSLTDNLEQIRVLKTAPPSTLQSAELIVIVYLQNVFLDIGNILSSDSMVQPQMDQDQFRNVSNLDLAEPNRIRDSVYPCIRLLFANFLTMKMLRTCTYR